MPSLSPTMEEGGIARWLKSEGDEVASGDVLAEIETDKATVGMESTEEGYLAKILMPAGSQNVAVGTPVAVLCEDSESVAAFANYSPSSAALASSSESSASSEAQAQQPAKSMEGVQTEQQQQEERSSDSAATKSTVPSTAARETHIPTEQVFGTDRIFASPAARKRARESGVDLSRIKGTGPHDRILLADVHEAEAAGAAAAAEYTDVALNNIRRITATRLQESKQTVPHFYASIECKMDRLLTVRAEMNEYFSDAKLSVNDFIMKAAARALHEVPEVNAKWVDTAIRRYHRVHMGVAVQTDSGLMVPVVKDVGTRSIYAVNADVRNYAKKAKNLKLQPDEMQGGTFTISNLGMYGVTSFSAIVNPPEAAILAVGTTRQEVVPGERGNFEVQNTMTVTLSADHRVVDGAVGAQWLSAFKRAIEAPSTLVTDTA